MDQQKYELLTEAAQATWPDCTKFHSYELLGNPCIEIEVSTVAPVSRIQVYQTTSQEPERAFTARKWVEDDPREIASGETPLEACSKLKQKIEQEAVCP